MRTIEIPKKSGGKRLIYVPDKGTKMKLRAMVSAISEKVAKLPTGNIVHGFVAMRSPVTNASAHVGRRFTLCFDLSDFFDSVTVSHLKGKLKQNELDEVLVEGAPRQGLPTSPAVANLAASVIDESILRWLAKNGLREAVVYTRYADDLSLSFDSAETGRVLRDTIPRLVSQCGFQVNPKKTRLLSSRVGRRIITGVAVGDSAIHPTRATKRRLRAALHQKNWASARGLREWMKLKAPQVKVSNQTQKELDALCKVWRLKKIKVESLPTKAPDEEISQSVIITSDPVYMLGMSTWTTGWTSCARQPNGQYRHSGVFWAKFGGTRLAALLSDRTLTINGITRRVMRARTLIHTLVDGRIVYDRLYGNPEDIQEMKKLLEAAGIKPAKELPGVEVIGRGPKGTRVYLDQLHRIRTVLFRGKSWVKLST